MYIFPLHVQSPMWLLIISWLIPPFFPEIVVRIRFLKHVVGEHLDYSSKRLLCVSHLPIRCPHQLQCDKGDAIGVDEHAHTVRIEVQPLRLARLDAFLRWQGQRLC